METEQTVQALTPGTRGRSLIQLPPTDPDELESPPNKGLNLRSLGRTIQRQALLIAGVATAVAVAASFQAMNIPPNYEGDFQLLVEPVTNQARLADPLTVTRTQGGGEAPGGDLFTVDYPTQIQILQSPGMLSSIVQQVQSQYPDFSAEQLKAGLTVERLAPKDTPADTKIIKVTYKGSDPGLVQKVLKVTADRYLQYSLEDRKSQYGEGIKFIENQLPEVQQQVSGVQDELQRLQQQYDLIDPTTQGGQLSEQIGTITTQQLETQRSLQEQRTLYANLQRQLSLTPEQAIAASALSEDPSYGELQTKLVDVQSQLAVETARFSEQSPVVKALREREKNITSLLSQRAQQALGQQGTTASNPQVLAYQNSIRLALIGQLVDAGNQIRMLEARGREIAQARGSFERRLQQFPAISRRYADLTRELDISTQTLNRLLTQRETLKLQAAQTEVPWQIVSEPLIPRDPEGNPVPQPSKASNLVIAGAALGLILGTLLALILEKYRNVFYTVEDMQEGIKMPMVGVIPFSRGAKQSMDFPTTFDSTGEIQDSRLETASFREAFSDLYSNIRLAEPPIRSLMICSAEPGDGKTTVALYLAQTAAGAGQRVLLVDTNLRLPQIHTRLVHSSLDLRNNKGLSDLLASNLDPNEVIQQSPLSDNLYVLTVGSPMPGSVRLLGSDQMKQLMEKFQATYDLVIYDTPHLFGQTDASFLTNQVDEILMVIAANKTNRTTVDRVVNKLVALRVPGISVVANYLREHNSSGGGYSRLSSITGTNAAPNRETQSAMNL
jgi:capsular exopolysaccharide synthesis family protein